MPGVDCEVITLLLYDLLSLEGFWSDTWTDLKFRFQIGTVKSSQYYMKGFRQ